MTDPKDLEQRRWWAPHRRWGLAPDQSLLLSKSWPPHARSVPEVRRALSEIGSAHPRTHKILALLGTELASNAVKHAGTWFRVEVRRTDNGIRLLVLDRTSTPVPWPPRSGAYVDPLAERGRGLVLVNALSTDWGVSTFDDGKTVWLDLATAS
jgi:anti-sigma regulatory factor (Ser/Thr protein kinase)